MRKCSNYLPTVENSAAHQNNAVVQRKLTVGASNDPLEHQADAVADKVMRMPENPFIQRKSSCACNEYDDERVHLKRMSGVQAPFLQAKGGDGGTVSNSVSNKIQSTRGSGNPMPRQTQSFMESRFGQDFSDVRIHTGDGPAQLNRALSAKAFTVGNDIYFNDGQYNPQTGSGRHLLAHELTHTIQQHDKQAVQRTGLLGDFTLTTKWDIHFVRSKPSPAEMNAAPASVLTEGGVRSLNMVMNAFQTNPALDAELEGDASIEGTADYNVALSIRRARYIANQLGLGRVHDVPGGEHSCPRIVDGIYGCGATRANANIDPADRRVQVSMFTPPSATGASVSTGGQSSVTPSAPNPQHGTEATGHQSGSTTTTQPSGSNQFGGSAGVGYLGHYYLSHHDSGDPVNEAIIQALVSYTRQFHRENRRGLELQVPLQLQISLTSGVITVASGGQLSYVWPFARDNSATHRPRGQFSLFGQLLLGVPVANFRAPYTFSFQVQPALGAQIGWQPAKWVMLGAQGSLGGTVQTHGPQSLDYGGLVFIQFNN